MSHRTPAYVSCVVLVAIVLSIPQLISGMSYLQNLRHGIPINFFSFGNYSMLQGSAFWEGKFCSIGYSNRPILMQRDPETGASSIANITMPSTLGSYQLAKYGNQLWLVGDKDSYQIVDSVAQRKAISRSPQMVMDSQRFLLNGSLAEITNNPNGTGFTVTSLSSNSWKPTHDVVFPDRRSLFGKTQIAFSSVISIECVTQGDRLHCFARTSDRLLYREGLPLKPIGSTDRAKADQTPSSLEPANANVELSRWSLVSESPAVGTMVATCGLLIDGRPAALIVDEVSKGATVGRVYRFDGQQWSLFETVHFPFGGVRFRTACSDDGERSYILMSTATGSVYVFSASSAGVKQALVDPEKPLDGFKHLARLLTFPFFALVLAAIQATITVVAMTASTHSDYGYGVENVQLASVFKRGTARAIDLALIIASACIFGRMLTYEFDWSSLAEALTLQVRHPTISQAMHLSIAVFLWLCVTLLIFVYIQGKWGITPGKWCCGLRVVQTTLKPCGFIRSLAREVTLAFESCYLLCWAPAIVAMALTDRRQRLGDWAADTIVIRGEIASMCPK